MLYYHSWCGKSRLYRDLVPQREGKLREYGSGKVHASFGSMSFVRLYQGKAVFLTAVLP
jgi:hypothetical protein